MKTKHILVSLVLGLGLTLGLLYLVGGQPTAVAAAPALDKAPSPSQEPALSLSQGAAGKPLYRPLAASGWTTKTPITIHYSGTVVLADFQISLTIPYTAGMQTDFDDLRFGDADGNCLSYWVETSTAPALVWVKVPSIPTPTTTIYMYYGNSAASSASNGEDTFDFFDDFEGTSLDTNKWDTTNAPSQSNHYKVENGYLEMWGSWGGCCHLNNYRLCLIVEATSEIRFFIVEATSDANPTSKCHQL